MLSPPWVPFTSRASIAIGYVNSADSFIFAGQYLTYWREFCYYKTKISSKEIGVQLIRKKFPIIPVVVIVIVLCYLISLNIKSRPVNPADAPPTAQNAPAVSASDASGAIKNNEKMNHPGPGHTMLGGAPEGNGMIVKDPAPYKPVPNSGSINSEWYTKDSPSTLPSPHPSDKATKQSTASMKSGG